MSVATVHVLHGIVTPSSFYSQVEDHGASPRLQEILGIPSGHPQPLFSGVTGLKPEVNFKTTQLATLLAECGLFGADLSAGNVDLLYKKVTNKGSREAAATTTHTRLRASESYLYWKTINAGHQKEAKADAQLMCLYDGTNAPIIPTGSIALSGTSTAAEWYTLGPIAINGSTLAGVQDCTIDLGLEMREFGDASEPYSTFGGVFEIRPTITLKGLTVEQWTTYGLVGTALTSLTVYLRKVNNDAAGGVAYVANGTAEHIKFTSSAGRIGLEDSSGGGNTEISTGLKLTLHATNASTHALTIATGQAIS